MRILFVALVTLMLAACTSVADYYNGCINQNTYIAGQVSCIKGQIAADQYLRNDTYAQEFIRAGDVLVEKVANGRMTEREAQLKLVERLNQMRQDQLREQAYQSQIDRDRFPRDLQCHRDGDNIYCTEY